MIQIMSVEIEGQVFITTAEAVELARELGKAITRPSVTRAAQRGSAGIESGIEGCTKIGDATSAWLIPKPIFEKWLHERKPRGKSK
jgi:hypothetical protein